ncbi:PQQ-dependent sugar dehydrogenase [Hymenobacter sp. B81]|uniref:PQQ-dependent sugar dehydrogenase n=1 Tax=Hymenobacter sp. B81 TaxID=3344878 RepID=UPI0037DCE17E
MKKTLRKGLLTLLGCGLISAAQAQGPVLSTFSVGSTTVTASQLSSGLSIVWELVWGPDDFLWMTERYGRISRINPATGQVLPLLTIADVDLTGEGGLLGMVLHPQFATSPYVYVVYNYSSGGALLEKLVRYTYSVTTNSLGSPLVLVDNIPGAVYHDGSRLVILPDNTLLMTTGDALVPANAQNPASLAGKTLRLNLDGSVPANNPTPGSLVYSRGHRNPQGLVQLPDGRLYSSEHGPSNDDEINMIEAGRNYGWPNVEGFCNLPAEQTFCLQNNVREPLIAWTPTIAPAALKYYDHPAIPGWRGSLLLATLKGSQLVQLPLTATSISSPAYFLNGSAGRLRALCVSPQGRVYVGTSNSNGSAANGVDRVVVLENRAFLKAAPPVAAFRFSLWPNPARQQATLQLPVTRALVTISDLLGRPVRQLPATTATLTLDLAGLPAGSYLVRAEAAAGTATQRLVVE